MDLTPTTAAAAPTQVRHPWRATARTVLQVIVSFGSATPFLVAAIEGDHPGLLGAAGGTAITVAAAVTRVMALPQVNSLLSLVGLSAAPSTGRHQA